MIFRFGSFIAFLQFPLQIIIHIGGVSEDNKMTPFHVLFFCVIIFLLFIMGYVILFVIPSKAEDYLKQTYPEYELS